MRHGIVLHEILTRLSAKGITILPFYLVEEKLDNNLNYTFKTSFDEYTIGFFGPAEMEVISSSRGSIFATEKLLAKLDLGEKCIGVKYKGEICAFMWINLEKCSDEYCEFDLGPKEAYLFNLFTMSSFRGKGVAPYLRLQSYKILNEMGRDTFYSISAFFNAATIKFKNKLNAKPLKLVIHIDLFKKLKWTFTLKTYKYPSR